MCAILQLVSAPLNPILAMGDMNISNPLSIWPNFRVLPDAAPQLKN